MPGEVGNFNNSVSVYSSVNIFKHHYLLHVSVLILNPVTFSLSRLFVDGRTVLANLGNQTTLSALENLSLAVRRLVQRQEAWPSGT